MKRTIVPLALATVLALSACSGHEVSRPLPSPVQVTPTTLTMSQAAEQYTKIVAPSNTALHTLSLEAERTNPRLSHLKKDSKAVADAEAVLIRQLINTAWPNEIKQDAEAVATEASADLSAFRLASNAKTVNECFADLAMASNENSAAQVMRAKLGLKEAPVG